MRPERLSKHLQRPQAIPRGFLRLYVLTLLSKGPESGSSILRRIDEVTEYTWNVRGTIYQLLEYLADEGLVNASRRHKATEGKTFSLTAKGKRYLAYQRRSFEMLGRNERAIMRLYADLIPSAILLPLMIRRERESVEVLRRKLPEVPREDRNRLLRELQLIYSNQLEWLTHNLAS